MFFQSVPRELKCSVQLELRNLSLPEIAQVNSKMIWLKATDEDEREKERFLSSSISTSRYLAIDQAQPAPCRLLAERVVTMIVEDFIDNSPEFVTVPTGLLFGQVGAAGVVLLQCGPVTQMLTI